MISAEQTTHEKILKRFAVLLKSERLAHAYLFIGPSGIGKGETALEAAKLINCEDMSDSGPCNACPSCIKISGGNHPDVRVIDSSRSESIKIEQIRAMINDMQMRPYEARRKVVIIRNTENLTLESANALLKTLEEPPATGLFILTTSSPEKNLDTIKSRCQAVHFFPSSRAALEKNLVSGHAVPEEAARFLTYYSEGYLNRACRFHEDDIFARKNEIIDKVIYSRDNDVYLKKVLDDKDRTKELLDVLYTWFRDLLLLKSGAREEHVINLDRADDLKKREKQYSIDAIRDTLGEIVKTTRLLNDNLNIKISFNIIKEKLWRKL